MKHFFEIFCNFKFNFNLCPVCNTTDIYDVENNTWKNGPCLKSARAKFGAATVKSTIYVLGLLCLFALYLTADFNVCLVFFLQVSELCS